MPTYRFIIEGSDFTLPMQCDGDEAEFVTGFFTTRRARGSMMDAAATAAIDELSREWAKHSPHLTVLDGWKIAPIELRRIPDRGHAFFSDDESRSEAASIEAEASRAPKNSAIWKIARLNTSDD